MSKHTKLQGLCYRLDGMKDNAEESIKKFNKKVAEDPHHAATWSHGFFEDSAKLRLVAILNEFIDAETPLDRDLTEDEQNVIFDKLGRITLQYALATISQSSSPTSNLAELEFQQAAASLYKDWFLVR